MMLVGEHLKKTRTSRQIELISVSAELRISLSKLEAIENDDYSRTLGDVYDIGFIRLYAEYLNLDVNKIVSQYKKQISFSESQEPIELPKPIEGFTPLISFRLISFVSIVLISFVFYYTFVSKSNLSLEYAIVSDISETLESEIEAYELETALKKIKIVKENLDNYNDNLLSEKNLLDNRSINAIAMKPDESDLKNLNSLISIKAVDSTWIQLRNNKNEIVYSKLMNKNEEYNFFFSDQYLITTGNAGNILVSIGGKVMGKLGKKGEVIDSISISHEFFSN